MNSASRGSTEALSIPRDITDVADAVSKDCDRPCCGQYGLNSDPKTSPLTGHRYAPMLLPMPLRLGKAAGDIPPPQPLDPTGSTLTVTLVNTYTGDAKNGTEISLSELGNSVVFQYGTAFAETNFARPPVPEPSSLALLGVGVLAMAGLIRRQLTPGG